MLDEKAMELLKKLGIDRVKKCSTCKVDLPISAFEPNKRYSDGYRGQCRECRRLDHKKYYNRNFEIIRVRTALNQIAHPREYWAYSTLCGHKKRGCVIELDRQDLIQLAYKTDVCSICGCELNWSRIGKSGSPMSNSPTLDRINQEKVIKMSNIQITCSRCNVSKNARSMSEFKDYCITVASLY